MWEKWTRRRKLEAYPIPEAPVTEDPRERAQIFGDEVHIDIAYPRIEGNIKYIVVGLDDVRAADGVRISYDFARDGWVVEQASTFGWEAGDEVCDPDWQEVAFVQAWGREKEDGFWRD